MAEDLIRYDILAQDALRGMVRKVLSEVAHTGLPGEHHFFITFATRAPGVRMSTRLMARYAADMTIVLQHQYWDLSVSDGAFEVSLSFGGTREKLHVPLAAVKAFVDPSVPFALQFEPKDGAATDGQADGAKTDAPAAEASAPTPLPAATKPAEAEGEKPEAGAAVVRLDAFRKKS